MRQCENIFVFIDLTKSIGSDLGGQCPPPGPPQTPPMILGPRDSQKHEATVTSLQEHFSMLKKKQ